MCGKIAQNIHTLLIVLFLKEHCLLYEDAMDSKVMIFIIKVMAMLHCHYISNDIQVREPFKNVLADFAR